MCNRTCQYSRLYRGVCVLVVNNSCKSWICRCFLRQRSSSERRNCRVSTWRVRDAIVDELCAIYMNPDLPFLDCFDASSAYGTSMTSHSIHILFENCGGLVYTRLSRKSCSFVRKFIQAAAAATLDDHKESRCLIGYTRTWTKNSWTRKSARAQGLQRPGSHPVCSYSAELAILYSRISIK